LAIMPLTQTIYAFALVGAVFARATAWRGITYRVKGPWQIRMEQYTPFQPTQPSDSTDSL